MKRSDRIVQSPEYALFWMAFSLAGMFVASKRGSMFWIAMWTLQFAAWLVTLLVLAMRSYRKR